jgi:hypothetical protein
MAGKFIPIREWMANGVEMEVSVGAVFLAEQFFVVVSSLGCFFCALRNFGSERN